MRRHVGTTFQEGPNAASTVRNAISQLISAAFGKGSERARGTSNQSRDGRSGRARAELGSEECTRRRPRNYCRIRPGVEFVLFAQRVELKTAH
jgi:hypothetical protein